MKNLLDEMQENNLLRIQKAVLWRTFYVLFFVILVQYIIGASFKEILGELIVLFFLSITIMIKCIRSGIWTSECKPSHKTNLCISLIVAIAIVLFSHIRVGAGGFVLLLMLMIFIICFSALTLLGRVYFKIYSKNEDDEDD